MIVCVNGAVIVALRWLENGREVVIELRLHIKDVRKATDDKSQMRQNYVVRERGGKKSLGQTEIHRNMSLLSC